MFPCGWNFYPHPIVRGAPRATARLAQALVYNQLKVRYVNIVIKDNLVVILYKYCIFCPIVKLFFYV